MYVQAGGLGSAIFFCVLEVFATFGQKPKNIQKTKPKKDNIARPM